MRAAARVGRGAEAASDALRVGFLCSHGGSNMRAIADAGVAEAVVVISNNSASDGLAWARSRGIATRHLSSSKHPDPAALDGAILGALEDHGAELVVLSGYMRKLGPRTLARYARRVLNVHPALLPRHGGQGMYGRAVHEAVLAAGDRETGATIHICDEQYDHGPVVAQASIAVLPDDTPETLSPRVLAIECELFVQTVARIASGELDLDAITYR